MKKILFQIVILLALDGAALGNCVSNDGYLAPVRFSFAARISDFSGNRLFFRVELANRIIVSDLAVDEQTEFPVGFEKTYKNGRYFIFVCDEQPATVAWVQKVPETKTRMESKRQMDERLAKLRKP